MIEITGMYRLLGRNMCQDLSELLWFYMHIDMFGGISIYNKETTYENAYTFNIFD